MSIDITRWKCNICGCTKENSGNKLPDDWIKIEWATKYHNDVLDLCNKCRDQFYLFLNSVNAKIVPPLTTKSECEKCDGVGEISSITAGHKEWWRCSACHGTGRKVEF